MNPWSQTPSLVSSSRPSLLQGINGQAVRTRDCHEIILFERDGR